MLKKKNAFIAKIGKHNKLVCYKSRKHETNV